MYKIEKTSKSVSTRPILLGTVKHTSKWPCLEYICIVQCMSMYTTLYTTHITFHNLPLKRLVSYVECICYVEGCKFSTSTHDKYRIVQNIVSAICGYFYASRGPPDRSEIVYTVKKSKKAESSEGRVTWLLTSAISRNEVKSIRALHGFTPFQHFFHGQCHF